MNFAETEIRKENALIMKEFILGIVQGLTEFFPVSSSGHLALFSKLMGLPSELPFFAFLHLGTFLAVLILLWNDVVGLVVGLFRWDKSTVELILKLIVSSIPAGLIGVFFQEQVNQALSSQKLVGVFFLATAALLWISDEFSGHKTMGQITYVDALVIGLFQAVAILPGVSRSGLTLIGALMIGMVRADAFKYSFLMSLPVVLAAGLFEIKGVTFTAGAFAGFGGALVAGLASLALMRYLTVSSHLKYFSIYLLIPAIVSFFVG